MELSDIGLDELPDIQQVALLRLQLLVTSVTHKMLTDYLADVRKALLDAADSDGDVPASEIGEVISSAESWFQTLMDDWTAILASARRECVAIPLGSMVVMHNHMAGLVEEPVEERVEIVTAQEPVYRPQLQAVLDAATNRIYDDGFQLSDRVWNLERESLDGIRSTLYRAIEEGHSAYDTARELEQFLGAGQDCPRWTSSRLYGLTPEERINSEKGLFKGSPCESKGVAYKALRLARNEIQTVHHEASRLLLREQPWVEGENIRLSPDHPVRDICDDYAEGGPYEIGEVPLPIHVQCFCYAVAVRMEEDDFVGQMKGWLRNDYDWPEMDRYNEFVGGDRGRRTFNPLAGALGGALMDWFQGNEGQIETRLFKVTSDIVWWTVSRVVG